MRSRYDGPDEDPRDYETWNRSSRVERTCARCGAIFRCVERLAYLPRVLCPSCQHRVVNDQLRRP